MSSLNLDSRVYALVFAGNEGAALPLAVAIYSALVHVDRAIKPDLYVLDNGISRPSRARLEEVAAGARPGTVLHWIEVPEDRLRGLSYHPRWTSATNARLLIPDVVHQNVQRVIFLDADILVRGDLTPLFTMDLGNSPIGAVVDYLERGRPYFNAGVLVMDLVQWRSDHLADRCIRYAAETGLESQDALNAVVTNWHQLPHRWNVQHGNLFFAGRHGLAERPPVTDFTSRLYNERWQLYQSATVLHFVGGVKPWDPLCPLPGTTAWVRTMLQTGWYTPPGRLALVTRYVLSRTRYWLGITRREWSTKLLCRLSDSPARHDGGG